MIELAKTTAVINTPIEKVFNYVSNMENYGHWFPGVVAVRSKNNLPHAAVGKTYVETLNIANSNYELTIEVVQCKTNSLFLTQGNLEGILPQMTARFCSDQESRCLITLQYHSRNTDLNEQSKDIVALRKDLTIRAKNGAIALKELLERANVESL
ncbi:MAG: SRPBCC family protein [Arenicella sp.]